MPAQLGIVKEPKSGSAVISAGPIVNCSPKYASAFGTAPGDDTYAGTAMRYDIRCSLKHTWVVSII